MLKKRKGFVKESTGGTGSDVIFPHPRFFSLFASVLVWIAVQLSRLLYILPLYCDRFSLFMYVGSRKFKLLNRADKFKLCCPLELNNLLLAIKTKQGTYSKVDYAVNGPKGVLLLSSNCPALQRQGNSC